MKKEWLLLIPCVLLSACNANNSTSKLLAERDSIIDVNNRQKQALDNLTSTMNIISTSLDSIAQEERLVYFTPEGKALPKQQVLHNLRYFEELLNRQRQQIKALQDSLQHTQAPMVEKLNNVISFLNKQLEEKDRTIQKLKKELLQKNKNISNLQTDVYTLKDSISELAQKNQTQSKALSAQSDMLNECYVKIGTRKELQQAGILSGGIFKRKINYSNLDKEQFAKVDIREFTEIHIASKRPKILTAMPEGSYYIEKAGDGAILHITRPTEFWSITNFLIIQTN